MPPTIGPIHNALVDRVARCAGHSSTAGVEFAALAIFDDGHFLSQAIDQINQPLLTEELLHAWFAGRTHWPSPGIVESEENLPLPQILISLAMHFDA